MTLFGKVNVEGMQRNAVVRLRISRISQPSIVSVRSLTVTDSIFGREISALCIPLHSGKSNTHTRKLMKKYKGVATSHTERFGNTVPKRLQELYQLKIDDTILRLDELARDLGWSDLDIVQYLAIGMSRKGMRDIEVSAP